MISILTTIVSNVIMKSSIQNRENFPRPLQGFKKMYLRVGTPLRCDDNFEKIGDLCYENCRDGYTANGLNCRKIEG